MGDKRKGEEDCSNGLPAKDCASEEYLEGYAGQYELEQILTARSEYQCKY